MSWATWLLVGAVLLVNVAADPILFLALRGAHRLSDRSPFQPQSRLPLSAAAELSARLAAHAQHAQAQDPRLPLPSLQDIEAIKKVAQILITLGQQVIPAIVGEPASTLTPNCDPPEDGDDNP